MTRGILVILLAVQLGCSIKKLTINQTTELLKEGSRAMESEPDLELARSAVPGQIKSLEGLLASAPRHRTLLELSARACLEFAFGFLEDNVESLARPGDGDERQAESARATAMYDRALGYALRLLETYHPGIQAAYERGGAAWEEAVRAVPAESVAGLTFGGMALASSINLNRHDPERLARLPRARALLERAREADPRFYHGGANMVLGIMASQLGDLAAARRYFREAMDAAGDGYLLPRVMMAKVLLRDRKQRRDELSAVLAVKRDAYPATRLANEVARRRAARYLAQAGSE